MINRAWNRRASFRMNSVTENNNPHDKVILLLLPVIISHRVNFKLESLL